MKKIITLLLFFSFHLAVSQNNKVIKISISFENEDLKSVLNKIEQKTDYHFYYSKNWLGTELFNENFSNVSVKTVLDVILKNTNLNFFIYKNSKIILTQNNSIHNELPEFFFGLAENEKSEAIVETKKSTVFYNNEKLSRFKKSEIVRIGKENRNNTQNKNKLTGIVKNSKTGIPISNLAIVVVNKNISTTTDRDGKYEIVLPVGLNILQLSALGIENVQKPVLIYNNGNLDFELNDSFEMLDEVVLKSNKGRNVVKAIAGITQIEVSKIKTIPLVLGERDILKVATTLPGISTAGEGSSGYNVRGGKSDQNLILLDNAIIYNPSHFFGIFSALNPFSTGQVNIYKGNIPAEFGGRLSSVFDINTKNGNTEKFTGEASIGPVMSNLTLEVPIVKDKSSLLVGGRSTYSDWILKSLDDESLKNSNAKFYDLIVKYNHNIDDKNTVKVSGYYSKDEYSITSDSLYSYSNRLFSLKWDHKINKNNKASLIIANSQYKFNINYENNAENDFDLGYNIEETELKLKLKNSSIKLHEFDYGFSGKLYKVNPGYVNYKETNSIYKNIDIPSERGLEAAIFVSDNYNVTENLLLDIGLRYSVFAALGEATQRIYEPGKPKSETTLINSVSIDKNKIIESYGGLEFRLSSRYLLGNDFSLKTSYNKSYQYIHTLSNNTTISPTDKWKLTDSNIKPQSAEQVSVGLFKDLNNSMYEISLEGYFKKLKNIVDYKVGANLLLNETIETEILQGEGETYGVEFLIKKTTGKLNGWLGYTYSRSWNKFNSEYNEETINNGSKFPSNYDKPHDFSLVANYKLTQRYSLSTNFVYQTGRPVTYPVGKYTLNNAEFVLYSDRNKFRIPDYFRLDLSLNIEGNHKIKKFAHSFWNISVYNVLGRNNPYSVFFVTEKGEIKAYQSSIFSIPIPTITYNFKF